jgi:hypothetical protein
LIQTFSEYKFEHWMTNHNLFVVKRGLQVTVGLIISWENMCMLCTWYWIAPLTIVIDRQKWCILWYVFIHKIELIYMLYAICLNVWYIWYTIAHYVPRTPWCGCVAEDWSFFSFLKYSLVFSSVMDNNILISDIYILLYLGSTSCWGPRKSPSLVVLWVGTGFNQQAF